MVKKKIKICKLTKKQNKIWISAFSFYLDEGKNQSQADKLAFKDLIKEFPKLKKCDKIK